MSTGVGTDEVKVTGGGEAGLVAGTNGDIAGKVLAERGGGGREGVAGLTAA